MCDALLVAILYTGEKMGFRTLHETQLKEVCRIPEFNPKYHIISGIPLEVILNTELHWE